MYKYSYNKSCYFNYQNDYFDFRDVMTPTKHAYVVTA